MPSWLQVSSSPVYKYPFMFENRDFSPPVWPTSSRIRWKRIFFKTLSKVEIFENAGFSFSRARTKREVFECNDVIHRTAHALRGIKSYFHRFSVFMWTRETIRIHYVRTRIFSKRGWKISVFKLKNPDTSGWRRWAAFFFHGVGVGVGVGKTRLESYLLHLKEYSPARRKIWDKRWVFRKIDLPFKVERKNIFWIKEHAIWKIRKAYL